MLCCLSHSSSKISMTCLTQWRESRNVVHGGGGVCCCLVWWVLTDEFQTSCSGIFQNFKMQSLFVYVLVGQEPMGLAQHCLALLWIACTSQDWCAGYKKEANALALRSHFESWFVVHHHMLHVRFLTRSNYFRWWPNVCSVEQKAYSY
jgi:hypothetical protein